MLPLFVFLFVFGFDHYRFATHVLQLRGHPHAGGHPILEVTITLQATLTVEGALILEASNLIGGC